MGFNESRVRRFTVVMIAAGLLACSSDHPPGPPLAEAPPGQRAPYVIGATDRLTVTVWKNPELGVTVPVRSDGKISVPLLDDVQAEGLTAEELKEVLTQELSEFVASPDVTVIVTEVNSRNATITGEVGRTGVVSLARPTRLMEAIAILGGFTPYSDKNDVRVLRRTPSGIVEYHFSYDDFVLGEAPNSNIVLEPGDHVVVSD